MKGILSRIVVTGLLILAAFLLQNNIFAAVLLIRTTPNLLLLVTVTFGLLHGKLTGLAVGFFAGLLMDMFGGTLLGQYALILSVLGYVCGFFTPYFFLEYVTLPMGVCAVCELIYGLCVCDRLSAAGTAESAVLFQDDHPAGDDLYGGAFGRRVPFSDVCKPQAG